MDSRWINRLNLLFNKLTNNPTVVCLFVWLSRESRVSGGMTVISTKIVCGRHFSQRAFARAVALTAVG